MEDEIKRMLDELAELRSKMDNLRLTADGERASIITPEIKRELALIDAGLEDDLEPLLETAKTLENQIKAAVVSHGAKVKSERLQAVYVKPRVSWDGKMLDGLAMVIPDVARARSEGKPSVRIQEVK
jgi:hypothetical protein